MLMIISVILQSHCMYVDGISVILQGRRKQLKSGEAITQSLIEFFLKKPYKTIRIHSVKLKMSSW